ncbi:MAG: methyltransferase domain-containing protein [Armatimonadota bacterium]|jgi:malonyl-CoA O-methyltransferase
MSERGGLRRFVKKVARCGGNELRHQLTTARNHACALAPNRPSAPAEALRWLREHQAPGGGILAHSRSQKGYPEVTGYLIPTLLAYGERQIAARFVRWLRCIQRDGGAFTDCAGTTSYVFDSAQALRGLMAGSHLDPGADDAAHRAAGYLCGQMADGGAGGFGPRYAKAVPLVPETVHLYALPPLVEAATRFNEPRFEEAALRCLDYYCEHDDFLRIETLTHFLAYELEPLIDLGREELARPMLDRLSELQGADGAVRGQGGAPWVCTPGLLQLAICWYRIGERETADRAVEWAVNHQRVSGGFLGSYGRGASYHSRVEIPWAVKFYLDAERMRVRAHMDSIEDQLPSEVGPDDGRLEAILAVVEPGDRVLDVGCGKGRFLRAIRQAVPDAELVGVDISTVLLDHLPDGVEAVEGALEAIPVEDESFDVVVSVEAVEHSANLEAAVAEMIRATRPGGRIMIIDKQQKYRGRLVTLPWERWPEAGHLISLLRRGCDDVICEPVSYGRHSADGMMVAWSGRRRGPLSGAEWNEVLVSEGVRKVTERVVGNWRSLWGQEIILGTRAGDRVLEVGSGTGENSLNLALGGRVVTALDIGLENLRFNAECAEKIGVDLDVVAADALRPLPFADDSFDCVFSAGLLDRVGPDQVAFMLGEFARVSRGRVITLVANAASLPYHAGILAAQQSGSWEYGFECPRATFREQFAAAGLEVTGERAVAARHAIAFLQRGHPLRACLRRWFGSRSEEDLQQMHQGYLLVTVGRVRGAGN